MNRSRTVRYRVVAILAVAAACAAGAVLPRVASAEEDVKDIVAYVGGRSNMELHGVLQLSDGAFLMCGAADDLRWIPEGALRKTLEFELKSDRKDSGRVPFFMRVTKNLGKITHVASLPKGSARDICFIKSPAQPGRKTGDLYLSGRLGEGKTKDDRPGYFLARLNGNFVDRLPRKFVYIREVRAQGELAKTQPWDVGGDGKVVYATGNPYGYDWMAVNRLTPEGEDDVVEKWRTHYYVDSAGKKHEFAGLAEEAPGKVVQSAIILKIWGRGDFRSWSRKAFLAKVPDSNGGTKQGTWPFDAMFPGYWDPETKKTADVTGTGKGYYGYRWGGTPCACVGAIAIDRRTNAMYIGGNNKSRLPDGNPDFEPWLVAMDSDGKLQWWSRLYPESKGVSTPDQYVDAVAVDYRYAPDKGGSLVVVARAHGNNVNNFWQGDQVTHPDNPGRGFQNGFTGTHGNMHYQWIGRLTLKQGRLLNCTYFAEYAEGAKHRDQTFDNPLLDDWPHFKSGWPNLNTTRVEPHGLAIDAKGNVYVSAKGRRVITTSNAYQQMPSPLKKGTRGQWSDFVRVYTPGLTTLRYSSLLHGKWDWDTGKGGSPVDLGVVVPVEDGLVVVGTADVGKDSDKPEGDDMPVSNVPDWGQPTRHGRAGVVGRLTFDKQRPR